MRNLAKKVYFDPSPLFGLRNLGNTCYFNSGLQLLVSSPEFISSLCFIFGGPDDDERQRFEAFSKLLLQRHPHVGDAHYSVWWEVYKLLSQMFLTEFGDIFRELRARGNGPKSSLSESDLQFIEAHVPNAAVVQLGIKAPNMLLKRFSEAHPAFEGMFQQDSSEMINQMLSSLDDVSRVDCFPHQLLAKLTTLGSSDSSRRSVAVLALMHLINIDNARRHLHSATVRSLLKRFDDANLTCPADLQQEYASEFPATFISSPPGIPRIFSSPHNSMFKGYMLSTVLCHRCLSESSTVQEFTSLNVDIPSDAARKRFAAENPSYVNRMRLRWYYDPIRQSWSEREVIISRTTAHEQLGKCPLANPTVQQTQSRRGLLKTIVAGVASMTAIDCYRKGLSFSEYPSTLAKSNLRLVALAAAGVSAVAVAANLYFASTRYHPSTQSVLSIAEAKVRYLSSLLLEPALGRVCLGLSEHERSQFISHCHQRIFHEKRVISNILVLFNEGDSLAQGTPLVSEDGSAAKCAPHPSCRNAAFSTFSEGSDEGIVEYLSQRCSHNGKSCFAPGEIDYPLTLDECLAIHTSGSEVHSGMGDHSNAKQHAGANREGFRCENCCFGGTGWSRGEAFPHSKEALFASRATADVKVTSTILSLPNNLVIHLKRIRPPDDELDAGGGSNSLQKIDDPILFPNSSAIPRIELATGISSCSEGLLDMAPYSSNISSSRLCSLIESGDRFCKQMCAIDGPGRCAEFLENGLIANKETHYRLTSVVNHHGDATGGHYTANSRRVVGMDTSCGVRQHVWFNFNDESVQEESLESVVSESVSKGSVFMFQQVNAECEAMKVAQRALLGPKMAEGVDIPRWWLIRAATSNDPGPIWTQKDYVSSSTRGGSFIFPPKPTQAGYYPNDWFYVKVPLADAHVLVAAHGGDLCL